MEAGRAAYCCGIILGFSLGFGAAHIAFTSQRPGARAPEMASRLQSPVDRGDSPNEIRLSFGPAEDEADEKAVVALAELPSTVSDDAPQTLSEPGAAAPLSARAVRDDETLRGMIREELGDLPASDLDVWYEALRDLPHEDATSILRIWKANRTPTEATSAVTAPPSAEADMTVTASAPLIEPPVTHSQDSTVAAIRLHSDNVANAETPGFKAVELDAIDHGGHARIDVRPGATISTGRPFDVRIEGAGFFAVKLDDELLYTRHGRWTLDDQRRLAVAVAPGRLAVVQPEIQVPAGSRDFRVEPDGSVQLLGAEGGTRAKAGAIGLWTFLDATALEPVSGGLYRANERSGAAWTPVDLQTRGWIEQNAYESSNVDLAREERALDQWRQRSEKSRQIETTALAPDSSALTK